MTRLKTRFVAFDCLTPEMVQLAKRRTEFLGGEFFLSRATVLDLLANAYLQGVHDAASTCATKGGE